MSDTKHTPAEIEAFDQWVEEYLKGKPYWSTARIEICRDAWMERAKRDAEPVRELSDEELGDILREFWGYQGVPSERHIREAMRAAIAKATGAA